MTAPTPSAIRELLRGSPSIPFEPIHSTPPHSGPYFKGVVDRMLSDGWSYGGRTVRIDDGEADWSGFSRSLRMHLHAWRPLALLLRAHSLFGDPIYRDVALAFALRWLGRYAPPLPDAAATSDAIEQILCGPEQEPWYDMGVALRLQRLSYLADVVGRDPAFDDRTFARLLGAVYFHHQLLADPRIFRDHNNHGLFQAIGQIAAARRFAGLPTMEQYQALGEARFEACLDAHFFYSGAHKEHSPGYHYGLLASIAAARAAGVIDAPAAKDRLAAAEAALVWAFQPDGALAPFGDTDRKPLATNNTQARLFSNPQLRHALTGGAIGVAPSLGVRAELDAGYAFMRLAAPDGRIAYLAHLAAFHSRAHKHADDGAFVWWDRDRSILTEPGRIAYSERTPPDSELRRRGFWYAGEERIFVESTHAHNTLEFDGESFPRARPYGSGLRWAGAFGDIAASYSVMPVAADRTFTRLLVLRPGEALLVVDSYTAAQPVEARQWFHLAPEWSAERRRQAAEATHPMDGLRLHMASLSGDRLETLAAGQSAPNRVGWIAAAADRLVPATAIAFHRRALREGQMVALFTLGTANPPEPVQCPVLAQGGDFVWRQDGREHRVTIDGPLAERPALSWTVSPSDQSLSSSSPDGF